MEDLNELTVKPALPVGQVDEIVAEEVIKIPVVVINTTYNTHNLPPGWNVITKRRKTGITKGRLDKYWVSPTGVIYNSILKANIAIKKDIKK